VRIVVIPGLKHARLLVIPGSEETAGHGTTAQAKWWKAQLAEFLPGVPRRSP
jgi:homoserine O-acetyltransferase